VALFILHVKCISETNLGGSKLLLPRLLGLEISSADIFTDAYTDRLIVLDLWTFDSKCSTAVICFH